MTKVRLILVLAIAAISSIALAACGSSSDSGGGSGEDATIIRGTTDQPISYDPAGAYDLPSWNVIYNVYQTLLRLDGATGKTVPWEEAKGYLKAKAAGGNARRPAARKFGR